MPAYPGCTPQSNITLLPLYDATMHERPTSDPAPSGMIRSMSSLDASSVVRFPPTLAKVVAIVVSE